MSVMQISPDQGQFMQLLVKLICARNCLEIGIYTGYSSLCVALAMPEDGKLVACDINKDWTAIAREYWDRAGVRHKIDLQLAPASQTLKKLLDAGKQNSFDFVLSRNSDLTHLIECKQSADHPSSVLIKFAKHFSNARAIQLVRELRKEEYHHPVSVLRGADWLAELSA